MKRLLSAEQINTVLDDLAAHIFSDASGDASLAFVGIRSRGEILALRLSRLLSEKNNSPVPCGTLDITLYRDDLNDPQGTGQPVVRTTEIDFDIDDKTIVLVDDVLFTGRSTRAAMDALVDLGRPRTIKLAVLIDRAGRELPIQADYAGLKTDIGPNQRVHVNFFESDGQDEVIIE